MSDKLHCPFCGAELYSIKTASGKEECWCSNLKHCLAEDFVGNKEIWQALIDGKKAQDALNKILAIKESVEGCCVEIEQHIMPLLNSHDPDAKLHLYNEVSAIDKHMSEIDEIASITKQENE